MRPADAYIELAIFAIGAAQTASDLRGWWAAEASRRLQYELSDDQVDDLVERCKRRVQELGDRVRE